MELHPAVAHLAPLLGTWRGAGRGEYPTIEPFEYTEEVTFGHVGKPFLAYTQRTRSAGAGGAPLHAECGYLRPAGEHGVEMLVVHPSGIAEVLAGEVTPTHFGLMLTLAAGSAGHVILTPTAKQVDATERYVAVNGDTLNYRVGMAAMGHPMTHHLQATLQRAT